MHSKGRAVGCARRCCPEGFSGEIVVMGARLDRMILEVLSNLVILCCSEGDAQELPSLPFYPPFFFPSLRNDFFIIIIKER